MQETGFLMYKDILIPPPLIFCPQEENLKMNPLPYIPPRLNIILDFAPPPSPHPDDLSVIK